MTRSVVDDVVVPMSLGPDGARCGCRSSWRHSAHHARLLTVETDPSAVLDLFELAVTWGELDYGDADVLPPEDWIEFASGHRWSRPDEVARLFALATDVAARGPCPPSREAPRRGRDGMWRLSPDDIVRGEL